MIENLRARGATHLFVNANPDALDFYERLGFREESRNLVLPLEVREVGGGRSFGSIHVQTDDLTAVERAVQAVRPQAAGRLAWQRGDVAAQRLDHRLRRGLRPRPGLAAAAGEGALRADGRGRDRDRVEHEHVVRFVLHEAGRIVDEYLSVPEYYGPLPPGDAIALAANPRVVARLTGADPTAVRAVARTAASPDELPPAQELLDVDCRRDRARRRGTGVGGVITLYDAARCPYCARSRIVLAEKGIPYETVEIDLADRPSWLYEMNPAGKVPVLDEDGWILPESAVIGEYLNERYPEPPLWPDDPGERAAGRLLVFRFDDFSKPYYAMRRGEEGARGRFEEELGFLDAMLGGVPWLSGRAFGLADIAFLPWLLRARDLLGVPLEPWPALADWVDRSCQRPSVAAEQLLVAAL